MIPTNIKVIVYHTTNKFRFFGISLDWSNTSTVILKKRKAYCSIFGKRGLEKALEKKARLYLTKDQWPLEDLILKKRILCFLKKKLKSTSIQSIKSKIKGFSFLRLGKHFDMLRCSRIEAFDKINSLLLLVAIELLSKSSGSITPGIDGVRFIPIPRIINLDKNTLHFFKNRIINLRIKLSQLKIKRSQFISRKKKY